MGMNVFFHRAAQAVVAGCLLFSGMPASGLDDPAATLRSVARAAREGKLDGIEPLKAVHDSKAGDAVVRMIEDKKVPDAAKQRIAGMVAQWPAKGGLDHFTFYLRSHDRLSDEMFRFYAELGRAEFKPLFLGMIASLKGKLAAEIKEPARVAVALRALGRFPDFTDDVVAQIASLLDEKLPHAVRASAADALGGIKSRRALPALVALVKDTTIGEAAQRSLFRLTGQDFGEDSSKWAAWLKGQGSQAELKMLGLADWETHLKAKPAAAPPPKKKEFSARFYGVEVKTRHCLFVLDCSGSMEGERITHLKEEMVNLLAAFEGKPKTLRFAIILFHTEVEGCFTARGLMPNDAESLKRASKYVDRIVAGGGTAMMSALQFVAAKLLPGGDVDTIYLLSDGAPTDAAPEDVLAAARKIHDDFQVKFHTIGIGESEGLVVTQDRPPTLLDQIAKATGGTYVAR
ncbi:MAG: VWA domain-containing protein [Verrucomicrobia bacterium]|nr:VWA domain-containing protein [Verrucomicrobiota bacterium]